MNKAFLVIIIVLITTSFSFAQENENTLKAGIKALTAINHFSSGDKDVDKYIDFGMGFGYGAAINIPLGRALSISFEMNILYRKLFNTSIREHDEVLESYMSEFAFSIPLMLKLKPIPSLGAYISLGGQLDIPFLTGLNIEKYEINGVNMCSAANACEEQYVKKRSVDFGVSFGAGYLIAESIGIDARAVIGMTTLTSREEDKKARLINMYLA